MPECGTGVVRASCGEGEPMAGVIGKKVVENQSFTLMMTGVRMAGVQGG